MPEGSAAPNSFVQGCCAVWSQPPTSWAASEASKSCLCPQQSFCVLSEQIAILSRLSAESCVSPREAGNRAVASSPSLCNRQFATQREKERSSCTISQQVVEKLEAETPLPVPRCPQDAHPCFSTLLQPCFTPLARPQQRKHVPAPSQLCSVPSSMQELKCLLVFRSELAPHAG